MDDRVIATLVGIYRSAFDELVQRLIRAVERGNDTAFLHAQLMDVMRLLSELDAEARRWIGQHLPEAYRAGQHATLQALQDAGVVSPRLTASFAGVHRTAVELLADNLSADLSEATALVGRRVQDVYREIALQTAAQMKATGTLARQGAREMHDELVSRGLTGFVDGAGRRWRLDDYADMTIRTTVIEAGNLGRVNQLADTGHDLVRMTEHQPTCPICVTGETLVQAPDVELGIRREYSGDLVRIRTASGNSLAGTPDHSILTSRGWRSLRDLKPGDEIVCDARVQELRSRADIVPDDVQMPTRIDEVFDSLPPSRRVDILSRPTGSDLNRDVFDQFAVNQSADREVDVVLADSSLWAECDATLAQGFGQTLFAPRPGFAECFAGEGDLAQRLFGAPTPAPSVMSGNNLLLALLRGESAPETLSGVGGSSAALFGGHISQPFVRADKASGARSRWDASALEIVPGCLVADLKDSSQRSKRGSVAVLPDEFGNLVIGQNAAVGRTIRSTFLDAEPHPREADTVVSSQLLRSLSGSVTFDQVVNVDVSSFRGHVYDLQTSSHWYLANGIISHNCAVYQGRVYSVSGNDPRYPALYETAFGRGFNIVHPRCQHSVAPYIEHLADDPERDRERSAAAFDVDPRSQRQRDAYEAGQRRKREMRQDRRQWERYMLVLPDDTPTFSGFRRMKRANSRRWQELQAAYRESRTVA